MLASANFKKQFKGHKGLLFTCEGNVKNRKLLSTLIGIVALGFSSTAIAQNLNEKVIYGTDSRQEVADYPDARFQEIAKSVAAMVPNSSLQREDGRGAFNDYYTYDASVTLGDRLKACPDERFADQPSLANCTGFLVDDDILVTAGHCVDNMGDCRGNKWVFGFKDGVTGFDADNVYSCEKMIGHGNALGLFSQKDYAVLKLDRKVENRKPLEYRKRGRVSRGDQLVVIGHPSGLPMKVADDAEVRRHRINFFYANTDTYGGNSGSPVFSRATGKVEGILVRSRAGQDYRETSSGCFRSRYISGDSAREIIHRITRVPEIQ